MSDGQVPAPRSRTNVADWTDFPTPYVRMGQEIESELDDIWPGWRECKPFSHLDFPHLARVKWLLKRYGLLSRREDGVPAPLDWQVHVARDMKNQRKCYAHPIPPTAGWKHDMWVPPPLGAAPLALGRESASVLAFDLRLPIEQVERVLPYHRPDEHGDVRKWLPDAVRRIGAKHEGT